mmetsp:Transcript_30747/g.34905  ORF Transcript_30747/g.34905 Transcript_30747/m.34905 type:complete len:244 (-) Transcript_30747:4-735(-)
MRRWLMPSVRRNTTIAEAGKLVAQHYVNRIYAEQDDEVVASRPKIGDSDIIDRDITKCLKHLKANKKTNKKSSCAITLTDNMYEIFSGGRNTRNQQIHSMIDKLIEWSLDNTLKPELEHYLKINFTKKLNEKEKAAYVRDFPSYDEILSIQKTLADEEKQLAAYNKTQKKKNRLKATTQVPAIVDVQYNAENLPYAQMQKTKEEDLRQHVTLSQHKANALRDVTNNGLTTPTRLMKIKEYHTH